MTADETSGLATAPRLTAGPKPGVVAVLVSTPANAASTVPYTATIETLAPVDTLSRNESLNGVSTKVNTSFAKVFTGTAWHEHKPVAGARVRFAIVDRDKTGTLFADGKQESIQLTGREGIASAPPVQAGPTPGTFTLSMDCQRASAQYSLVVVHE